MINALESGINFDFTWNGRDTFIHCGGCNGPMQGHRAEKCRKVGEGYDEVLVVRFEREMRSCPQMREAINKYIDMKKKEEIERRQDRKIELQKRLLKKNSLMIGRTEIQN